MNTIALYMTLSFSALQTTANTQTYELQVKQQASRSLQQALPTHFSFTIKTDTLSISMLVDQPTPSNKATVNNSTDTQPLTVVSTRLSD